MIVAFFIFFITLVQNGFTGSFENQINALIIQGFMIWKTWFDKVRRQAIVVNVPFCGTLKQLNLICGNL